MRKFSSPATAVSPACAWGGAHTQRPCAMAQLPTHGTPSLGPPLPFEAPPPARYHIAVSSPANAMCAEVMRSNQVACSMIG